MAEKIKVLVEVDPEYETVIKPFAAELAKQAAVNLDPAANITTGTATATYNNGSYDGDGTID